LHKLQVYDIKWIEDAIFEVFEDTFLNQTTYGLSGMASGVDLWFCGTMNAYKIPYSACVPFEGQEETMDANSAFEREYFLKTASKIEKFRNSIMVEKADAALVVFDGNKGGTHNVFQQLIEKQKPFVWINPVGKKIWECN
jgi:uncharacterized phage-like protein YoqJ